MFKYLLLLFFFSSNLHAVNDTIFQKVSTQLQKAYHALPTEKIYVHQDRTHYLTGETMWLKVYQDKSNDIGEKSGIVYIQLINRFNQSIIEKQWPLQNGIATGDIAIPDTLQSGNYQLRAYTQYMQNFGTEHFFTREINITNQENKTQIISNFIVNGKTITARLYIPEEISNKSNFKYQINLDGNLSRSYQFDVNEDRIATFEIQLPEETETVENVYFILITPKGNETFPIPLTPTLQVSFLPEGGHLVAGLPSKVAIKATDQATKGIAVNGKIIDEEKNVIRNFKTEEDGLGYLTFIPKSGIKYLAVLDSFSFRYELPKALEFGIVQQLKRWNDQMRITLFCKIQQKQDFYLLIHQQGKAYYQGHLNLSDPVTVMDIPFNKLPDGLFTVTIYDNDFQIFSERLAFVKYPPKLPITIETDAPSYQRRKKVTLSLDFPSLKSIEGDFSIGVIKAGLDNISKRDNYYTHFHLGSELKGQVENSAVYFEEQDTTSLSRLDLVLLTHGWRCYSITDILSDRLPQILYPIEKTLGFSGRIRNEEEKLDIEEITLNALYKYDSIIQTYTCRPAKGGVFQFTGFDFTGTAEILLSALDKKSTPLNISLIERIAPKSSYYSYLPSFINKDEESVWVNMGLNRQILNYKNIDKIIHELPEISVTAKKKKKLESIRLHNEDFVNHSYTPQEDIHFGSRIENLLFRVPGLKVYPAPDGVGAPQLRVNGAVTTAALSAGNNNQGSGSIVANSKTAHTAEPIIVLDGFIDHSKMALSLPPEKIKRVEVLYGAAALLYAPNAFAGVVAFYTKSPNDKVNQPPVKFFTYKFPGYNQTKKFYSPEYSKSADFTLPDHRNTLLWNPIVCLNAKGKTEISFYTSDDIGDYDIHCEGRSKDGKIGVQHITFHVE